MTGENFEGDPAKLREFMAMLDDASAHALAIRKDMLEGLRANNDWYGLDDPYAVNAGKQFRDTVRTLDDTLGSLADAVIGINTGRELELKAITGASYYAKEQISKLQHKTDGVTDYSGGGKSH
ncbi:hypothetical protein ABZV67_24930 [Streptomyces sp. NPDC005065]|uniref:hypothetical protein n=1 Tax=Streptomyces sp. NPDC005065 TaxID=3154461 RepID=UPI0033AB37C3